MSHANAALTPRARLRLARLIVDDGWTLRRGGEDVHGLDRDRPQVGRPLPRRRAGRDGRPQSQPAAHQSDQDPRPVVRQIVRLRWRQRLGPVQIGGRLGLPASTVHAVLIRCRLNRLSRIDRVTGEPIRRYEHAHPGSLIHVDVTKFGNIPDGGGHRFVGRQQGDTNRHGHRPAHRRTRQATTGPGSAPPSCTPSSTTTPASPTSRSAPTRRPTPPSGCCTAPSPGSPNAASPSNACCPTTAAATVPRLARRLRRARHHPQADPPLPTTDQRQDRTIPPHPGRRLGLRPLLRLRSRTPSTPSPAGSTSTITTEPTPPSAATTHQQAEQPAWTSHLAVAVPQRTRHGQLISRPFAGRPLPQRAAGQNLDQSPCASPPTVSAIFGAILAESRHLPRS